MEKLMASYPGAVFASTNNKLIIAYRNRELTLLDPVTGEVQDFVKCRKALDVATILAAARDWDEFAYTDAVA